MPTETTADPSPFFLEAGPTAILLIHGFTGSPAEMRPLGHYLHERDLTVWAPLLPGHGTTAEDLNRQSRQDWYRHAENALVELQTKYQTVFVAGLSLGSLLTLSLAARQLGLGGAIVYSPALKVTDKRAYLLPLLKHLVRQLPQPDDAFTNPEAERLLWSYDTYPTRAAHEVLKLQGETKARLPDVHCPLLVIYSTIDDTIHPDSAQTIIEGVSSGHKELVTLHNSGHVLTLDGEWEEVAEHTYQFIRAHAPPSGEFGRPSG